MCKATAEFHKAMHDGNMFLTIADIYFDLDECDVWIVRCCFMTLFFKKCYIRFIAPIFAEDNLEQFKIQSFSCLFYKLYLN